MDNINLIIALFILFYIIFNYIKLSNKNNILSSIEKEIDNIEKEIDTVEKEINIKKEPKINKKHINKQTIYKQNNNLLYPVNSNLINVSEFGGSKPYNNIKLNDDNINLDNVYTIYNKKYNSYRKYKLNK